jgi:hypothetical protein
MVIQQTRPPVRTWLLAAAELSAALIVVRLFGWIQHPQTACHHHGNAMAGMPNMSESTAPQIHWGLLEYVSIGAAVAALGWWLVRRESVAAVVAVAALATFAASPAVRGLASQSHLIAMVALELLMVACPLLLLREPPRPSVCRPARRSGWTMFGAASAVLYAGLLIAIHLPAVHRHGAGGPLWVAAVELVIGIAYWFGVLCTADRVTTRARRVMLLGAQEVAAFIGLLSLAGATWDQRVGGVFMMATCAAVTIPVARKIL